MCFEGVIKVIPVPYEEEDCIDIEHNLFEKCPICLTVNASLDLYHNIMDDMRCDSPIFVRCEECNSEFVLINKPVYDYNNMIWGSINA